MLTTTLAINPDEMREFIVQQTINHGVEIEKLKAENKTDVLEFGKWIREHGWVRMRNKWHSHQTVTNSLTDDEIYTKFKNRLQ
jgi:hypothetical protein